MARYSFTINHMRTSEDFDSYAKLIDEGLFQGIEIFYPYQHLVNNDIDKFNLYTENVYKLLKGRNIEVVLHLPFGGHDNDLMREDNEEVLKRMYDAIDYANKFGAKKLTLHLGSTFGYTKNEYLNKSIINVCALCNYALRNNQYIMIENMPSNTEVGTTVDEMKYVIEGVIKKGFDNVKLIYDTGHGHVAMKNTSVEKEFLTTLRPYLYHFHINDNDTSRDQHKPIGQGNVDFKELLYELNKGYTELYTLEILFKTSDDLRRYQKDLANILEK